jgi:hypothetical protein
MADNSDKHQGSSGHSDNEVRQHRLKLALRENLKRRKSQARERSKMAGAGPHPDASSPDGRVQKKPGDPV